MITLLIVALSINSCGGCRHYAQSGGPVIWATCTEGGYGEMYCDKCGKLVETYSIDPLGHEYVNKVVESTCSDMGYIAQVCERCEDKKNIQYLELLPHTEEIIPGVESTCTEHGLTEGKVCSVCDKVLASQEEAPLKAHEYDDNKDAICNNCGYERYCVHRNTVILEAKEPTCTSTGLTAGKKCADCEEVLVEQEIVSMLDHNYEFVTVVDPTCEIQGYTKHACACGAFYNDNFVDALMHDYGSWYMYRDETTPIEGEGRRDCQRENCEYYDIHVASSGFTYRVNSDKTTCTLIGIGTCSDTELFLPFSIDGYEVTILGIQSFYECDIIRSVIIPNSVISIGKFAFKHCTLLANVVIPDSVRSIDIRAFEYCHSLASIVIPDSVTSIGENAFDYCRSLHVIYNNSELDFEIGNTSNGCIAKNAKILVNKGTVICINDGYEYILTDADFLFRYASAKYELLAYCGYNDVVTLPLEINSCSYDILGMRGGVINVIIPNGVTKIGSWAFSQCTTLKSIDIPETVTSIDEFAFYCCSSLTSITIPTSVTSIDGFAFGGCSSLTNVTLKNANGWMCYVTSRLDQGISISNIDLKNTTTAAEFLTSTYSSYCWRQEQQ